MSSEVSVSEVINVELPCETDSRLGDVKENAAEKHNPEKKRQAQALEKKYGKKRIRSLFLTYWCDSDEKRDETFEFVKKVFETELRFICYGAIERSEENKKPHCHALVMFRNQKTWLTVVKTFDPHEYHIEPAMFPNSDYSYCKKEDPDNIKEWGEPPHQGSRTDLKKLMEDCNYSIETIMDEDPLTYCRYRNGIKDICEKKNKVKNILARLKSVELEDGTWVKTDEMRKPPIVKWIYGPAGTGKSTMVEDEILQLKNENKIDKEKITVIDKVENGFALGDLSEKTDLLWIDDFRGSTMAYNDLLKLIDGRTVNKKGSQIFLKAKYIYITSSMSPEDNYSNLAQLDGIRQLLRRITEIIEFEGEL